MAFKIYSEYIYIYTHTLNRPKRRYQYKQYVVIIHSQVCFHLNATRGIEMPYAHELLLNKSNLEKEGKHVNN